MNDEIQWLSDYFKSINMLLETDAQLIRLIDRLRGASLEAYSQAQIDEILAQYQGFSDTLDSVEHILDGFDTAADYAAYMDQAEGWPAGFAPIAPEKKCILCATSNITTANFKIFRAHHRLQSRAGSVSNNVPNKQYYSHLASALRAIKNAEALLLGPAACLEVSPAAAPDLDEDSFDVGAAYDDMLKRANALRGLFADWLAVGTRCARGEKNPVWKTWLNRESEISQEIQDIHAALGQLYAHADNLRAYLIEKRGLEVIDRFEPCLAGALLTSWIESEEMRNALPAVSDAAKRELSDYDFALMLKDDDHLMEDMMRDEALIEEMYASISAGNDDNPNGGDPEEDENDEDAPNLSFHDALKGILDHLISIIYALDGG